MLKLRLLVLLLLSAPISFAQTPAQTNKRLFDKTVDELNFRTFETVYDKSFTRGKFPVTLRTAAARRAFDQFGDNAGLKQLFLNYNSSAERYKNRFGNGPLTLTEFEKQLNDILRDRNFEFFIHNLPRDERAALIHAEQRLIKQASAQFNAAGAGEATQLPADVETQAEVPMSAPLTTNDLATPDGDGTELPIAVPANAPDPAGPRHDWLDYFTLLLSLTSVLMLAFLLTSALPALRRRINRLAADPAPEPESPNLMARLRPTRSTGPLQADRYEDDPDDEAGHDEAPEENYYPEDER